ncbi:MULTISPECIES: hypothetical protein [unclassified Streptomyces]|uniref:hypothetical protein n=1 Tax=Streptomyces sp. NPDC127129 TaxID=3345373 RepID=UPI00362A60DF
MAVGSYFLATTIQETRDLNGGVGATAVLMDEPSDCFGGCRVTFDVAGSPVVAELPAYELIKKFHKGSDLSIVHASRDPQRIALADGIGPGPIALASLIPVLGLTLAITSSATWIRSRMRRSRTR